MQSYLIDELSLEDYKKIKNHLLELKLQSSIDDLFWFPIPQKLLSPMQLEHSASCAPYVCALELSENSARLELLVRSTQQLRCDCIAKASPAVREHMIEYLETTLTELGVDF